MADDRSTILLESRPPEHRSGREGRPFPGVRRDSSGDFPDLAALGRGHGFLGIAEPGISPGLDFNENESRTVTGDDVDFPPAVAISTPRRSESARRRDRGRPPRRGGLARFFPWSDFPADSVLRVFQNDPGLEKLAAEAVGLGPILGLAGQLAGLPIFSRRPRIPPPRRSGSDGQHVVHLRDEGTERPGLIRPDFSSRIRELALRIRS